MGFITLAMLESRGGGGANGLHHPCCFGVPRSPQGPQGGVGRGQMG